jgi:hypothetical protein
MTPPFRGVWWHVGPRHYHFLGRRSIENAHSPFQSSILGAARSDMYTAPASLLFQAPFAC